MANYKNGETLIAYNDKDCIYVGVDPTSEEDVLWHVVIIEGQSITQIRDKDLKIKPFTHGELIMHGNFECYYMGKHPKHKDLSVVVMKKTDVASTVKTMFLRFKK